MNAFGAALEPPRMVRDVAYWLNAAAEARLGAGALCALNAAVEESTVADRGAGLLVQDAFVRDAIGERVALRRLPFWTVTLRREGIPSSSSRAASSLPQRLRIFDGYASL